MTSLIESQKPQHASQAQLKANADLSVFIFVLNSAIRLGNLEGKKNALFANCAIEYL